MPSSRLQALKFLETQWPEQNNNKIKGILTEVKFKNYLDSQGVHYISGGWILIPGKNTEVEVPTKHKICLLPQGVGFSWISSLVSDNISPALISAYNYFREVGVTPYIVKPKNVDESSFKLPSKAEKGIRANYPKPYDLGFYQISRTGQLVESDFQEVFANFPKRKGNSGLKTHPTDRLSYELEPWIDKELVSELFWFEYVRYYCQVTYLTSNNDMDMFLIGDSGRSYPVEIKGKSPAEDKAIGEWFGLDIGPFAKMAFFTANSMNTDSLYVVQELDEVNREHISWQGIKFTELVKSCSWVFSSGGKGMSGGASSTLKVPKSSFSNLTDLMKEL